MKLKLTTSNNNNNIQLSSNFINNGVQDVKVNGTSVVTNNVAQLEVIDNLTSTTETSKPLSAKQGAVLKSLIKLEEAHSYSEAIQILNRGHIPYIIVNFIDIYMYSGKGNDHIDSYVEFYKAQTGNLDIKFAHSTFRLYPNGYYSGPSLAVCTSLNYESETYGTLIPTKDAVNTGLDTKVNKSDIVDNLNSTDSSKVLSAKQGKTLKGLVDEKQDTLVSGTNVKKINNASILGSGNIEVQPTLVSGTNIKTINYESLLGSGNITIRGLTASVQGKCLVLTGGN